MPDRPQPTMNTGLRTSAVDRPFKLLTAKLEIFFKTVMMVWLSSTPLQGDGVGSSTLQEIP